jgi:hypothetical protein
MKLVAFFEALVRWSDAWCSLYFAAFSSPLQRSPTGFCKLAIGYRARLAISRLGTSPMSIAVLLHGPYIHTEYLNFDAGGAVIAV